MPFTIKLDFKGGAIEMPGSTLLDMDVRLREQYVECFDSAVVSGSHECGYAAFGGAVGIRTLFEQCRESEGCVVVCGIDHGAAVARWVELLCFDEPRGEVVLLVQHG